MVDCNESLLPSTPRSHQDDPSSVLHSLPRYPSFSYSLPLYPSETGRSPGICTLIRRDFRCWRCHFMLQAAAILCFKAQSSPTKTVGRGVELLTASSPLSGNYTMPSMGAEAVYRIWGSLRKISLATQIGEIGTGNGRSCGEIRCLG